MTASLPPFNIQAIDTEPYCAQDIRSPVSTIEGAAPTTYANMQEILKKWQSLLFPQDLFSVVGYEKIIKYTSKGTKEEFALAFHHQTHLALTRNKPLSEAKLQKISQTFWALCTKNEGEEQQELIQLSLHPRMLAKYSEEFLKQLANHTGQKNLYQFIPTIDIPSLHRDRLFPEKYATLSGIVQLDILPVEPDFETLPIAQAIDATVLFILQVISHREDATLVQDPQSRIHTVLLQLLRKCKALEHPVELNDKVREAKSRVSQLQDTLIQAALESNRGCLDQTLTQQLEAAEARELLASALFNSMPKTPVRTEMLEGISSQTLEELRTLAEFLIANIDTLTTNYTEFVAYAKARSDREAPILAPTTSSSLWDYVSYLGSFVPATTWW